MKKDSKALIYPANTVAGYGHIFSLGIAGIDVVALSPGKCANFKSRYIKERHIVPNPLNDHEEFVSWLITYAKKQQEKSVLFLAEDLYSYIASLYKRQLSPYYLYPYIDRDKLDIFFNKKEMYREAARANIMYPHTLFSPLTDEEISDWKYFPAVMKPLVSRFTFKDRELVDAVKFPTLFGGKAIQVSNKQEIRHFACRLNEKNIEYCIQELIAGENENIANIKFVSAKDGSIPSYFISRKIRQQPADFGTCCVSRSEHIKCLHEYAEEFCKITKYVGPGCMEFKWNPADRSWYFIEINPRLDFWVRMSTIKGINLPLQQYLVSTGQELFLRKQRNKGRYWIHIPGDLRGLKWRMRHKEWSLSIMSILKPYSYFNDAIFNFKDPLPGLLTWLNSIPLITLLRKLKSSLQKSLDYIFKQRAPLQEFSNYGQYWNKRRHLGTDCVVYARFFKAMEYMKREFSVLDYGCGSGAFLKFIWRNGYKKLYGADMYRPVDLPKGIKFYDIEQLPKELKFDVVTLLQVAEHVQDAEQLIMRLLKLTDRLIVSIPNLGYWQHRMRLFFGRMPITDVIFHIKEHVRFWTKKDFIEMCNEHNWQIKHVVATVPDRSYLAQWMPSFFARQIMYVLAGEAGV